MIIVQGEVVEDECDGYLTEWKLVLKLLQMPKVVDAATAFREVPAVFIDPPNGEIEPMRDHAHGSSSRPSAADGDNLRHNGRACVSDCGMPYGNRAAATPLRNSSGLRSDGLAPRVVYVYQREHGTVLPNLVEVVGTDEMTTCIGVALRNPETGRTSVGHLDHEDCVANGINAMVASLGPANVAYELHIIGGFDDSHSCIEDDKEVILVDEDVDGDGDGDDSDSSDDDDEWPLDDAMPMNRTSNVVLEEVDEVDEERVTGMGATSDTFSRSAWESGGSSHVRNIASEVGGVSTLTSCSAIEDDGCVSRNEQGEAGATSAEDRKGKKILDWEYDSARHRQMDRMEGIKEHVATAAVIKVRGGGNDGAGDGFPGHSWPLATVLINCLHRSSVVFELKTACLLHLNTCVGANGASCPIVRGFGVVPTTGRIFPAQFAPEARCPDGVVRGVFITFGSNDPGVKGTLVGPYDTNTDSWRIGPYPYPRSDTVASKLLLECDENLLKLLSTSPSAEAPDFLPSIKKSLAFLKECPDWRKVFPMSQPRVWWRTKTGGWRRHVVPRQDHPTTLTPRARVLTAMTAIDSFTGFLGRDDNDDEDIRPKGKQARLP